MYPPATFSYPPPTSALPLISVCLWISVLILLPILPPILCLTLLITHPLPTLPLLLAYLTYITYDGSPECKGGWGVIGLGKLFYNASIWNAYREYFTARLVKTVDLPMDRNYVFSLHPHGVYALGFFANVTGNPRAFGEAFPGIKITATTLPLNFRLPVWREFLLSLGMVSCDRKALERVLLPKKAPNSSGNALIIVTGGGEEYLYMTPKTMDLVLTKRKGFVKLALTTGASLVPIITFGENDVFTRIETPLVKRLTAFTQWAAHFAFPAFSGRFGLIVRGGGAPIFVTKVEHPTEQQVNDLHAEYVKSLEKLYDEYKDIFFTDRIRDMRFVK
ncbi:diacylglycerol acyltransferase [Chytridium lagenaria]|nr:diacylglycerol acyltransferase [Chytridium lagenaria]